MSRAMIIVAAFIAGLVLGVYYNEPLRGTPIAMRLGMMQIPELIRLEPEALLARCIYGEARSEGVRGMTAVANVVRNRMDAGTFGGSPAEVILDEFQFSCFRADDPNYSKMLTPPDDTQYRLARVLAALAMADLLKDVTSGATHYYASWMEKPPVWAKRLERTAQIGQHIFLKPAGLDSDG